MCVGQVVELVYVCGSGCTAGICMWVRLCVGICVWVRLYSWYICVGQVIQVCFCGSGSGGAMTVRPRNNSAHLARCLTSTPSSAGPALPAAPSALTLSSPVTSSCTALMALTPMRRGQRRRGPEPPAPLAALLLLVL